MKKTIKIKITNFFKSFSFKYITVPLLSAIIGSSVTLAFAPYMEKIRYSYWEKQHNEGLNKKSLISAQSLLLLLIQQRIT